MRGALANRNALPISIDSPYWGTRDSATQVNITGSPDNTLAASDSLDKPFTASGSSDKTFQEEKTRRALSLDSKRASKSPKESSRGRHWFTDIFDRRKTKRSEKLAEPALIERAGRVVGECDSDKNDYTTLVSKDSYDVCDATVWPGKHVTNDVTGNVKTVKHMTNDVFTRQAARRSVSSAPVAILKPCIKTQTSLNTEYTRGDNEFLRGGTLDRNYTKAWTQPSSGGSFKQGFSRPGGDHQRGHQGRPEVYWAPIYQRWAEPPPRRAHSFVEIGRHGGPGWPAGPGAPWGGLWDMGGLGGVTPVNLNLCGVPDFPETCPQQSTALLPVDTTTEATR